MLAYGVDYLSYQVKVALGALDVFIHAAFVWYCVVPVTVPAAAKSCVVKFEFEMLRESTNTTAGLAVPAVAPITWIKTHVG